MFLAVHCLRDVSWVERNVMPDEVIMRYYFDWDPQKATANIKKHKIGFDQGTSIFLDKRAITIFDDEHSENGDRWITIGTDANGALLVVVHTFRQISSDECKIRIISVRNAIRPERIQYGKGAI